MTRPVGKTREERITELSSRSRYTKTFLVTMLRALSRRTGFIQVGGVSYERLQRAEIIDMIIEREYHCRECRGLWAHLPGCSHYTRCPADHPTTQPCSRCKKPNGEQAPTVHVSELITERGSFGG